MITTIALDLDNTLLTSDKTISPRTETVLKQLHQAGKRIVLCTGRPIKAIQPFLKQLALTKPTDYSITFNGGLVQQNTTGDVLARKSVTKANIQPLYDYAKANGFPLDIIDLTQVYSIKELGKSPYEAFMNGLMPFSDVSFADLPADDQFGKVVSAYDDVDKIQANLPQIVTDNFHVVPSRRNLLEYLPAGTDKSAGLKALLANFNEDFSNLMAFGDEENDLGMLKAAKVGVAMANAIPVVKAATTDETLSNDDDGVAVFLENYFD
ncbi:Cof-type HAD-IIB family hydrolase [Lactiplantibacillus mudanjiangensis]|uniref:Cof-type HAD-IIB family hydrolase [Lactobacillus sp.] n=1 Tax=Lactiplantibacillus mudanjiangensis TaxID=1296538 RepID=A0A660DWW7_9LACO|nr:Cof-type HAD-IIB family hydrolase [Lactiplantibacillus mudanjiangensis]VDG25384.1 Cof-type HAD-IIB family hydrolase [Lactobacillus sp.] [Lactiplantibacillus mudanjiangensis]VDG27585.1 Cof-type HAD-IIB family hydrolase [Lactobacillus sp.] [Lactiplantibacillus mudanjiangensis]VDG32935.1 Cof-type HAD-IIB family hydrolase [Lactobacillus sp.] [Lactiplantibacillus mudanjiangensis]